MRIPMPIARAVGLSANSRLLPNALSTRLPFTGADFGAVSVAIVSRKQSTLRSWEDWEAAVRKAPRIALELWGAVARASSSIA